MTGRPKFLALFTGTGTGVGKTWVAARTLEVLAAGGLIVAARKPVQSSDPGQWPTDAEVLAAATGEQPEQVCQLHRRLELPLAPPIAARELGRETFTVADLVDELIWPTGIDVGIVEGVGGPASPIAESLDGDTSRLSGGDTIDLCNAIAPDVVVIVAESGLGAINAVLLAAASFAGREIIVALNRFDVQDRTHYLNREWLMDRARLIVVTSPAALAERLRP